MGGEEGSSLKDMMWSFDPSLSLSLRGYKRFKLGQRQATHTHTHTHLHAPHKPAHTHTKLLNSATLKKADQVKQTRKLLGQKTTADS